MELEQDLDALPRRQASIQHHAEQKQMARQTLRLLLVHVPEDNRTTTSMPMSSTHVRLTSGLWTQVTVHWQLFCIRSKGIANTALMFQPIHVNQACMLLQVAPNPAERGESVPGIAWRHLDMAEDEMRALREVHTTAGWDSDACTDLQHH